MNEYPHEPVPHSHRQPPLTMFMVSLGLTAVAVNMILGGTLGVAMPPRQWVLAIVIGGIILAAVAGYTAWFSFKTGMTFALQMQEIFGLTGSRVISAAVGLIILGWYTIQSSLLGHLIGLNLGLSPNIERLLLFVIPFVLAISAIAGFRGLTVLSWIAIPTIFSLSAIAVALAPRVSLRAHSGDIGMNQALTMVLGLWIMGAVATIGDIARYASSKSSAVLSAVFAFLLGNTLLMLAGAWCGMNYGYGDLSNLLLASGLPILSFILLVFNIWSTNDNAIYSVGLNWAHTMRLPFRPLVIVATFISALVSLLRPYESDPFSQWLTVLGIIVPSVGGAIIGYRSANGRKIPPYASWLAIAAGVAVSVINPFGLAPIWGLLTSALIARLSVFIPSVSDRQPSESPPDLSPR